MKGLITFQPMMQVNFVIKSPTGLHSFGSSGTVLKWVKVRSVPDSKRHSRRVAVRPCVLHLTKGGVQREGRRRHGCNVQGTKAHDPIALRIKGCTKQPCQVEKGSVAVMEVDFEVGWDVTQLDVVVTAYALGTVINFPLKQKNACMSLTNAECPLDQYEEITYRLQLDIDSKYPSVSKA
ncbi:hypothetical protein FOCC_FOCC016208 [Frankliniella occidentalis]|nr:hypothetical protein FOCC_FOCC016208 [Frankliniella occidentalis]